MSVECRHVLLLYELGQIVLVENGCYVTGVSWTVCVTSLLFPFNAPHSYYGTSILHSTSQWKGILLTVVALMPITVIPRINIQPMMAYIRPHSRSVISCIQSQYTRSGT